MKKSIKSIIAATMAVAMMIPCAAVSVSAATIEATSTQLQSAENDRWNDGGYINSNILNLEKVYSLKENAGKSINLRYSYNYSELSKLTKNGKNVTGLQLMVYNNSMHRWEAINTVSTFGKINGGYFAIKSSKNTTYSGATAINISHLGSAYRKNNLMRFALCPVVYESGRMSFLTTEYYTPAVYYSSYNGYCFGTFR